MARLHSFGFKDTLINHTSYSSIKRVKQGFMFIYIYIHLSYLYFFFDITSESSYLCLLHSNFYKSIMHGFMADFFVCYISIQTPHFDVIYPPFSGNKRVRIQSKLHVTAIMSHEPWFMNIFSYEYYKIRSRKHVIVISFHSKYYILILGVVHVECYSTDKVL